MQVALDIIDSNETLTNVNCTVCKEGYLIRKKEIFYCNCCKKRFVLTEINGNNLLQVMEIVAYLNVVIHKNYKYNSKYIREKINARLNEGYKVNQFKTVIKKKYEEWKDTEFEQHLNPIILFGNKFEIYLNQKINGKKETVKEPSLWENKLGIK